MVFEWQNGHTTRCLGRPLGAREPGIFPSHVLGAPSKHSDIGNPSAGCHLATLLAWKRCRGVKTLHGLRTDVYMAISALHYCKKKKTRVYLLGTRTNSFCICCSIYQKWLILPCFIMFYSLLLLSFFMTSGHASNSPFQVVYFCFQIKFSAYPNLKIVFSQLLILNLVTSCLPFLYLRTGSTVSDRLLFI